MATGLPSNIAQLEPRQSLLSLGLFFAGSNPHQLAQIAMPIEIQVLVHLVRYERELDLVGSRELPVFLFSAFDDGPNQGGAPEVANISLAKILTPSGEF